MRISDWSSDVCSSDLNACGNLQNLLKPSRSDRMQGARSGRFRHPASRALHTHACCGAGTAVYMRVHEDSEHRATMYRTYECRGRMDAQERPKQLGRAAGYKRFVSISAKCHAAGYNRWQCRWRSGKSEEHTSELQSLMRISYAVFCLN